VTLGKSVLDIRFHLKTDFRDNAQDNEIPCWLAKGGARARGRRDPLRPR
jgi:hypothetical protein